MRADDYFALFWKDVTTLAENNLVNVTVLSRWWRLPARYEDMETPLLNLMKSRNTDTDTFTLKPLTMSITDRFDQHDYKIYINCELRYTPENCKRWRCYIRI